MSARYELLTDGASNPKTAKPVPPHMADAAADFIRENYPGRAGFLSAVLHLAPATLAGKSVCPWAATCAAVCLNTAGRGAMDSVQSARIRRTRLFHDNRAEFVRVLVADIARHRDRAARANMVPVVRLNGTSDIPWWTVRDEDGRTVFEIFPDVVFYDYTKRPTSLWPGKGMSLPRNYSLTFSHDPGNGEAVARDALARGRNVTVVFDIPKGAPMPDEYLGRPVVDGYSSDLRFLDPVASVGYVVGLPALGRARHSEFAVAV